MQWESIYHVASVANWCGKPCSSLCAEPGKGRKDSRQVGGQGVSREWKDGQNVCELLHGEGVLLGCAQDTRQKLK